METILIEVEEKTRSKKEVKLPYYSKAITNEATHFIYKVSKGKYDVLIESVRCYPDRVIEYNNTDCHANAFHKNNVEATEEEWREALTMVYEHIKGSLL